MKNTIFTCYSTAIFLLIVATDAYARAGGGGGGGGSGRGSGILGILLAPFAIIYYLYKKARINIKSSNVRNALAKIASREPKWSEENIVRFAEDTFTQIQQCWSEQDLTALQNILHPDIFSSWARDIKSQQARNERNEINGLSVDEIFIIDVQNYLDDEKDNFTVYFRASCSDKVLVNNQVISENNNPFEEFWTFEMEQGKWRLLKVTQISGWSKFVNRKIINEGSSRINFKAS